MIVNEKKQQKCIFWQRQKRKFLQIFVISDEILTFYTGQNKNHRFVARRWQRREDFAICLTFQAKLKCI